MVIANASATAANTWVTIGRVRNQFGVTFKPVQLAEFDQSLTHATPPAGLSPALEALWHEKRGNWGRAHDIAQDDTGRDAAWVHVYLHRREGDLPNAAYWYRQAAQPVEHGDLDEEWRAIVGALL